MSWNTEATFIKYLSLTQSESLTLAEEALLWVETPNPPWEPFYHLGNNKGVLELMKSDYELKPVSHLDNVYFT